MGARGPVPRRSSERRRRNREAQPDKVQRRGVVKIPTASGDWHPVAHDWYTSLAESGQSEFFEPSDWQAARYVAEVMSKNLNAGRFSAMLFTAVWSSMSDLLTTESARRRARVEVERLRGGDGNDGDGEKSKVTAIDEYRRKLGA